MKTPVIMAAAVAMLATPALAHANWPAGRPVYSDSNHFWLDYKTDISEAQRELQSDLRHAHTMAAHERAWDEYHRELADARHDFRQAMAKRGVYVTPRMHRGIVTVG